MRQSLRPARPREQGIPTLCWDGASPPRGVLFQHIPLSLTLVLHPQAASPTCTASRERAPAWTQRAQHRWWPPTWPACPSSEGGESTDRPIVGARCSNRAARCCPAGTLCDFPRCHQRRNRLPPCTPPLAPATCHIDWLDCLTVRSICREGRMEAAVAAGVLLCLVPESTLMLTRATMLSPEGRSKTLDASAGGCGVAAAW